MTAFSGAERTEAEKYFMEGVYPHFCKGATSDYRWCAWQKDSNIYMVILRTDGLTATAAGTAPAVQTDIPLVSDNGMQQIGAFSATLLYGGGTNTTVSGSGRLRVSVGHRQALVYKISGI